MGSSTGARTEMFGGSAKRENRLINQLHFFLAP